MDQLKRVVRPTDVPDSGILCDLLWSDPQREIDGWGENDRGVSFTFGKDVVAKFLKKHDLDLICRAHQVCLVSPTESLSPIFEVALRFSSCYHCILFSIYFHQVVEDGYEFFGQRRLVTIFSAPNYCGILTRACIYHHTMCLLSFGHLTSTNNASISF